MAPAGCCGFEVEVGVFVGDGVPKMEETSGSWATSVVVGVAESMAVVVGSSWVIVVCLVTVTVESLGIVCVTPEARIVDAVLEGGDEVEDDEVEDEEGDEGDENGERVDDVDVLGCDGSVLVSSSMGWTVIRPVVSNDMVVFDANDDEVSVAEDEVLVENAVAEPTFLRLRQVSRRQGSMLQQVMVPSEELYHLMG